MLNGVGEVTRTSGALVIGGSASCSSWVENGVALLSSYSAASGKVSPR